MPGARLHQEPLDLGFRFRVREQLLVVREQVLELRIVVELLRLGLDALHPEGLAELGLPGFGRFDHGLHDGRCDDARVGRDHREHRCRQRDARADRRQRAVGIPLQPAVRGRRLRPREAQSEVLAAAAVVVADRTALVARVSTGVRERWRLDGPGAEGRPVPARLPADEHAAGAVRIREVLHRRCSVAAVRPAEGVADFAAAHAVEFDLEPFGVAAGVVQHVEVAERPEGCDGGRGRRDREQSCRDERLVWCLDLHGGLLRNGRRCRTSGAANTDGVATPTMYIVSGNKSHSFLKLR